jgi:tetratricopeptide (TPR) repeat protein
VSASVLPADARLAELDAALKRDPNGAELLYLRAARLAELGRDDEARQDYLAVIARAPTHFGALNDLATLLHRTDFRTAARLAYAEAVKHHPNNPIGRINLGNALLANDELEEALKQFEAALGLAPDHPDAHQGLANLLQQVGDWDAAEEHRQRSYRARAVTVLPYRGDGPPCRVLLLVSAVGGNVPTRFVLEETRFAVSVLVVEAFAAETALPRHDLVFNAIGDADICAAALDAADLVLARTDAPVINPPDRIRRTGRAANARTLAHLPGVVAPKVETVARDRVGAAAETFGYPLLLRSPGYHTGRYFQKVEHPDDLAASLATLPGRELLLIQFLDAHDALGHARKYRVMMIGGELFPLHLAISQHWKVHYFTADMFDRPQHRQEEAKFLADMPTVLGPRAMAALTHIRTTLRLDYSGIDFGLDADGSLLLFEANATMVVNPPGPEAIWDYRRAPVERILAAARAMVTNLGRTDRLTAD